ncbi:hypothetical protein AABB24_008016 [Solanum stoloniferum]|uniref:Uncharacterized protein n=1 Tax=Solanum stoloniferum TaxID=62892 RepID=A0ABD2URR1_9SOLN
MTVLLFHKDIETNSIAHIYVQLLILVFIEAFALSYEDRSQGLFLKTFALRAFAFALRVYAAFILPWMSEACLSVCCFHPPPNLLYCSYCLFQSSQHFVL